MLDCNIKKYKYKSFVVSENNFSIAAYSAIIIKFYRKKTRDQYYLYYYFLLERPEICNMYNSQ